MAVSLETLTPSCDWKRRLLRPRRQRKGVPDERAEHSRLPADCIFLKRIAAACRYTGIETFTDGARSVYETLVGAFAAGNITSCADLLSPALREGFTTVIAERLARGETVETMFIGFRSVTIEDAGRDQGYAWIDVRFVAELVSVTRDRDGQVIAGCADRVAVTSEIWTFERDLRAGDQTWLLVATDDDA